MFGITQFILTLSRAFPTVYRHLTASFLLFPQQPLILWLVLVHILLAGCGNAVQKFWQSLAGHGGTLVEALAFVAIVLATVNVVGGYGVTQRMLKMFRKG